MVADTVAALIPALNEEKSVGKVVQGVLHYVSDVYVIDDHSMDSTRRAAKNAGAVVISNEYERGIERATLFGIRSMDFSNIIILDADGQHAPKFIPSLLEPLKKNSADLVIGRRRILPTSEKGPRDVVLSILGKDLDAGSGFRAFKRKFLKDMTLKDIGYCGCGSFVLFAAGRGARITEVPFTLKPRMFGRSKFANISRLELHRKQSEFLRKRYSANPK